MNIRRFAIPLFLSTLAIVAAGCGDSSTQFVTNSLPKGEWRLEELDSQGGTERRHLRDLVLTDTLGTLTDSFSVKNNGVWELDSTSTTLLHLQGVGDGYQRVTEIRNAGTSEADTLLRYWYFFKRNDSLYSYAGMRFVGSNPGLKGSWSTDKQDSVLLEEMTSLNFVEDSVTINHRSTILGNSDSSFGYHINLDTLIIDRADTFYGNRFEVVPGFALYITTHAGEGLARRL